MLGSPETRAQQYGYDPYGNQWLTGSRNFIDAGRIAWWVQFVEPGNGCEVELRPGGERDGGQKRSIRLRRGESVIRAVRATRGGDGGECEDYLRYAGRSYWPISETRRKARCAVSSAGTGDALIRPKN